MEKVLTTKQAVTFAFLLPFLTKLLVLPSVLANFSGKYGYLVVFLLFLIETCLAYFVLKIIQNSKSKSFFSLLTNSLGNTLPKIIIFLFAIYFFVKALLLILETSNFFNYSFYENFSPYLFMLGLFILLLYVAHLKLKIFAHSIELFKVPFIFSITIAIVASFLSANPINSLPILEVGWLEQIFEGFSVMFWFGDFLVFFLFIGRVNITKNFTKKALTSYFLSGLLISVFMFNFYNMFNVVTTQKTLAFADILNMVSVTSLNKIDWLIIFIWSIALIYGVCFTAFLFGTFIKQNFNKKYKKIVLNFGVVALSLVPITINFNTDVLINFLTGEFVYFAIVLHYVLPTIIIFFAFKFLRGKNSYEK
jgi:hypothetical protein